MKELIKRYEAKRDVSDVFDKLYENNPDNKEIEVLADYAYKKYHEVFVELVEEIVKVSGGRISMDIAKKMIITDFDRLKNILNEYQEV